ncbi:MAG TPA: trypsin-like peptidase domain-containing protein [Phycisphaerales bacterium]|nr:trypsin-like peptidase domain-containing protein [Phycisphaerales bacterium]
MSRHVSLVPSAVVLLAVLVTLVAAPAAVRRISLAQAEAGWRAAQASLDEDDILERLNAAVRAVARAVEPSVVHIAADHGGPRGWQRRAQGSGWVFDDRGHIVTNAHVVRGSAQVAVQFFDGRTSTAEVVGADRTTDIAVLRVRSGEGMFPIRRATGESLEQGDRVYAFGSPFGFKFSMSEGIISGLGRDPNIFQGQLGYTNFIQTDAAVNPGNSGGPLVDVRGRIVGMNVAIATGLAPGGAGGVGQSSGISFAIPLDTIESVVEQLISRGFVAKGYMGIEHPGTDEQNSMLLRRLGIARGVVVTSVVEGGPAATGGMRQGDVIVALNGRAVSTVAALRQLITVNKPGDTMEVTVLRDGVETPISVVLGSLAASDVGVEATRNALGEYGLLDVAEVEGRLVIGAVRQGSDAAKAGLRPGLLLIEVEGRAVNSVTGLLRALAQADFASSRPVTVRVMDPEGNTAAVRMVYR